MTRAADDYEAARPGLADTFLAAIESATLTVLKAPERWPPIDRRHHRYILPARRGVPRFPFSIFYRFTGAEVVVVAIAHHKREPGYWAHRR